MREANALCAIANAQPRPACTCSSVQNFRARLRTVAPSVIVTRVRLNDGYSDDVLALLAERDLLPNTKVIVLARADCPPKQEARHLALGADCVLRDPLRVEVLVEYIGKFLRKPAPVSARAIAPQSFSLGGATVHPDLQKIQYDSRSTHISPKEIELARLLAESIGGILTYDILYSELFGRVFYGDSSNLRVLLAKLIASYRKLGIDFRVMIRAIPKAGYAYLGKIPGREAPPLKMKKPRPKSRL